MSKRKGSRWERKFVAACQDHGLVAQRVPLSGAMDGYPGDVVVSDSILVECKYRRKGSGFKRLYDWIAGHDRLAVMGDGVVLFVRRLSEWADLVRDEPPAVDSMQTWPSKTSGSSFTAVRNWVGECAWLAVRMPRSEWLVIEVVKGDALDAL